jgi:hypothetical protein
LHLLIERIAPFFQPKDGIQHPQKCILCGDLGLVVEGGDGQWREFCRISDQVVTREEFLERQRVSSKFDSGGSIKEF